MNLTHDKHEKGGDSDEYATPRLFFEAMKIKPKEFYLDACAPKHDIWQTLPVSDYCQTYYALDEGQNAIYLPLKGHVFMNPPFSINAKSGKDILLENMRKHGDGIAVTPIDTVKWFYFANPEIIFMPQVRQGFVTFNEEAIKTDGGGGTNYPTVLLGWGEWAIEKLTNIDTRLLPGRFFYSHKARHDYQDILFERLEPA